MSLLSGFLDLLFPPRQECPFCRVPRENSAICQQCKHCFYQFQQEPVCFQCGRYFQEPVGGGDILWMEEAVFCRDCSGENRFFSMSRAAGPYEGVLKDAVQRLKYTGRRGLAAHVAQQMFEVMADQPLYLKTQTIVAVPLAASKQRQRGFNQSDLLAWELAGKMTVEMLPILRKVKDTLPQAGLNKARRKDNLLGAFALTHSAAIKGKTVLLIDDVVTTCNTLNCVSEMLLKGGAGKVICAVAAAGRVSGSPLIYPAVSQVSMTRKRGQY